MQYEVFDPATGMLAVQESHVLPLDSNALIGCGGYRRCADDDGGTGPALLGKVKGNASRP